MKPSIYFGTLCVNFVVWYTPYQFRIEGNVCLSFCKTNYNFKMSYRYEFFLIDFVMYFILCLEILQQRIFAKTFLKIFVCLMVHIFLTSYAFFFFLPILS